MRRRFDEPDAATALVVSKIRECFLTNGRTPANETEWSGAMGFAKAAGVHCGPPPTPTTAAWAALATEDAGVAQKFRVRHADVIRREALAVQRWKNLTSWLAEPTPQETAEVERLAREAAQHQSAIQHRAREILAEQQRVALERAVAQASKELA